MENNGFKGFITSTYGKILLNVVFMVICYGALILIANSDIPWLVIPLGLACTVFGWSTLGETSWWIKLFASGNYLMFHYIVKFMLSLIIGYFVIPFKISRKIVKMVSDDSEQ